MIPVVSYRTGGVSCSRVIPFRRGFAEAPALSLCRLFEAGFFTLYCARMSVSFRHWYVDPVLVLVSRRVRR